MQVLIMLPIFALLFLLCRRGVMSKGVFAAILIMNLAVTGLLVYEALRGPRQRVASLDHSRFENGRATLEIEVDEREGGEIELEKAFPGDQKKNMKGRLARAERELPEKIRGKNRSLEKVEFDLVLPSRMEDEDISIYWYSDRPDLVDTGGRLVGMASSSGEEVCLRALIFGGQESLEFSRRVRIYPSRELHTIREAARHAAAELNAGAGSGNYRLPGQVEDHRIRWYFRHSRRGGEFLVLSLLAGTLLMGAEVWDRKRRKSEREAALEASYPEIVEKLQLLMTAGLSMRKSLARLYSDYERQRKSGGSLLPAYEEIGRCCYEMESGTLEREAFRHLAENCASASYRRLALLLAESQQKGGAMLVSLLEAEVRDARSRKRRRVREDGERTGLRLLMPMTMMMGVVLLIIMAPAILAFT